MSNLNQKTIIGIDLGTTNSSVAIWKNGAPFVVPNEYGERTTPSWVAFTDTERLVGRAAKEQALLNPSNTIYNAKRLIGRNFDDTSIESDIKTWPFKVMVNQRQQMVVSAIYRNIEQYLCPEELQAMILGYMKNVAENYLGEKIADAVIAVPAYFNDAQRHATIDAAQIAGLNCHRIINEPTAAALSYGLNKIMKNEECVMVYDLGAGTLDVSLLEIENGTFHVLSTNGDTHLGGEDFDNLLTNFLCIEFNKKYQCNIQSNKKAYGRIKNAAEKAKVTLSSSVQTSIDIEALYKGIDFHYVITRSKFEELCSDLFNKCLEPLQLVLDDAKKRKEEINEIILVGGATRMPRIQSILKRFFNGKELNKSVNPDEAVACGAAIQAAILSKVSDVKNMVLLDVVPLSLGVETAGGIMNFLIPKNTPIPYSRTETYTTHADRQTSVTILMFEGERQLTKYNRFMSKFDLVDIPPAPRGQPQIEVTYEINHSGILTATAFDTTTKNSNKSQVKILKKDTRLSAEEITKSIEEADRYKQDDLKIKAKIESKNKLESIIYLAKQNLLDPIIEKKMHDKDKLQLTSAIANVKKWIDDHPNASFDELEQFRITMEHITTIIYTRMYTNIPRPENL